MWTSNVIACICLLLCVCSLTCEGGYMQKRPTGCYYSRRQCEAKCCCSGKKCEPTAFSGRTYYKCVTDTGIQEGGETLPCISPTNQVNCGSLSDPSNGYVAHVGGTTFESFAEYRCNDGYILSYPADRTCLSTGLWSAAAPTCEPEPSCGKTECPVLEHPCNGFLVDPPINPKPGDVATYDCMEGFVLDGENARACQDDYTWDGISPCCVKRTCREMPEYGDQLDGSKYRLFGDERKPWADARVIRTTKKRLDGYEFCPAFT